eukprot:181539_1
MGGDGGVYAVQRKYLRHGNTGDYVEDKEKKAVANSSESKRDEVTTCALSKEPLRDHVVACELGYMYNKDTVLTNLLEKTLNPTYGHLRGLKDIVVVKLTKSDGGEIICPVTLAELTSGNSFCLIFTTGWVLSARAIREVGIDRLQEEYGPFSKDDIVRLAPSPEERNDMRSRLLDRRQRLKEEKRAKKDLKRGREYNKVEHSSCKKEKKEKPLLQERKPTTMDAKQTPASIRETGGGKSVQREVERALQDRMAKGSVFSKLFGEKDAPSSKHDLFITAGHRYTLG